MEFRAIYKTLSGLCLNLTASWYAAVLVLPNFISIRVAILNLMTSLANGTLLLVFAYLLEMAYERHKYQ